MDLLLGYHLKTQWILELTGLRFLWKRRGETGEEGVASCGRISGGECATAEDDEEEEARSGLALRHSSLAYYSIHGSAFFGLES